MPEMSRKRVGIFLTLSASAGLRAAGTNLPGAGTINATLPSAASAQAVELIEIIGSRAPVPQHVPGVKK